MKKRIVVLAMLVALLTVAFVPALANGPVDSVQIDSFKVGCGEQTIHITGTATYQEGHTLRVDLGHPPFYGNIFVSLDKLPSWDAGSYTVGVGSWGIRARIYTEGPVARMLSEDIFLFEVEECPYQVCDEVFRQPNTVVFSAWSAWAWDAGRGLYVSTRIKYVTKTWVDDRNREHVCRTVTVEYPEERTRGPDCIETIALEPITVYGPWSAWVWDVGRNLYVRTRTVTTTIIYVDPNDQEYVCGREIDKETEEQTKGPDCAETIALRPIIEYGPWSEWVWDAGRDLYVRSRLVTTTIVHVDSNDRKYECFRQIDTETEEQTRGPGETVVDVGLKCCMPEDGVVYQLHGYIDIAPPGGATVTFDGTDYTETGFIYAGFGTRSWSAVANPGFTLIGDSEGTFTFLEKDCNEAPPEHPPTGAGPDLALPIVVGVAGLALLAMGARLVFIKKRD